MHLKNGAVLKRGEYRIEKLLGQGGFGITYLAVQSGLDRKVAIKEFFMKDLCERDADTSSVTLGTSGSRQTVIRFKEKFIREAKTIASLRHPNIVNIHDVFEENGTAYYVMEYHDGGSLSSLDLPLSVEQASGYIRQIASALSYLHKRNTMHLDVKPSNILLDESGNAVLIDFGVSKHYDQAGHQTSSTPVGISHGYAPGEQYQQNVLSFSPTTDIYALGATFYKLLTGLTPPHQNEVAENGLPVFPSSVPASVASVIDKAMQPRRKDRPQSIEEFLGLLDAALAVPVPAEDPDESTEIEIVEAVAVDDSEPVPTPSHESRQSTKKPSRKWLWWLVALLVAVVGAAAVLFMGKDAQPAGSSETPSSTTETVRSSENPSSQTEADQARSDAQQYASLMEMGAEYEENDATLNKAKEKYTSAKELEEKWSQSKDYGSLFSKDAAGALRRVEDKLKELEKAESKKKAFENQFKSDLATYNDLISSADKLCDKGDESSLKTAIEKYKSAAEIESRYKRTEYSDRFNRAASTSAGRAEKRLSDVQAALKQAKEQAAAKKKAEEATKKKAAGSASLTGTHKSHEWVDLGLSVKWATCNVGASNPGEYGNYYAWGETTTMKEYNYGECASWGKSWGDIGGNSSRDAATANWGGDWRLPTKEDFEELREHCTWEWTTLNGHNGYKVTSKQNGQSIFLPAAGYRGGDAGEGSVGSYGDYWSSTPYEGNAYDAFGLYFIEDYHSVNWYDRDLGRSVRPVLE
ncbi:MAG: hypothetical protein E7115_00405 [Bacteroidales bacterium]|nr:hypothetical protein [Bacteroidales bacterium]